LFTVLDWFWNRTVFADCLKCHFSISFSQRNGWIGWCVWLFFIGLRHSKNYKNRILNFLVLSPIKIPTYIKILNRPRKTKPKGNFFLVKKYIGDTKENLGLLLYKTWEKLKVLKYHESWYARYIIQLPCYYLNLRTFRIFFLPFLNYRCACFSRQYCNLRAITFIIIERGTIKKLKLQKDPN